MVENGVTVHGQHMACLLETSTSMSNTISCLSCVKVDGAIMHTN